MNWDWEKELRGKKEIEFFEWLRTWVEAHKIRPRKIIAEMKWNCRYTTFKSRSPQFTMAPPPIHPIGSKSSDNTVVYYSENDLKDKNRLYTRTKIIYDISRLVVRIEPYLGENINEILLIDEQPSESAMNRLRSALFSIRNKFSALNPMLGLNGLTRVGWKVGSPYDKAQRKKMLAEKEDQNNAWEALSGAAENERRLIETPPHYAASFEQVFCHMVSIYILHYDWIHRNVSKNCFLDSLELKKENRHKSILTIEQLLNEFSEEYDDMGFQSLINIFHSKWKEIKSFDLMPPKWFKYIPIHIEPPKSLTKVETQKSRPRSVEESYIRQMQEHEEKIKAAKAKRETITQEQVLSDSQKMDYEKFEYQCYDKVFIPGTIPISRSNFIEVNGNRLKIGDSLFCLFLLLVVELKKGDGGWVNIKTLSGKYQIYSNLRTALQGSLLVKDGQKFIQSDGSKNYRVSTHPDFITYDKEKLLNHQDHRIRELAEKSP